MKLRKSFPSKRRRAAWVHHDCYYGPERNAMHWKEAPAAEQHPKCSICGLPFVQGQVVGKVPFKYLTLIQKV